MDEYIKMVEKRNAKDWDAVISGFKRVLKRIDPDCDPEMIMMEGLNKDDAKIIYESVFSKFQKQKYNLNSVEREKVRKLLEMIATWITEK